MSQNTINNITNAMRILKIATCPNSSGKATLTYHIGCNADNEIQFRIMANTGGGLFSPEWIALSQIQPAIKNAPEPLTSYPFHDLYQGKSINTPAFLMAALKNEGLVCNLVGKIRGYEILDSKPFTDAMQALIDSGVNLKAAEISSNYKTSYPIKKEALASKTKNAQPQKLVNVIN